VPLGREIHYCANEGVFPIGGIDTVAAAESRALLLFYHVLRGERALNREVIPLNGFWDFNIPGGRVEKKKVPSSSLCIGESSYHYEFRMKDVGVQRVLLYFEGIAYEAHVEINAVAIGDMLPYSRYVFDITERIWDGINTITVRMKDLNAVYGPVEGWENYGGIIRDIYIEIVDPVYISDYTWRPVLAPDCNSAECMVNVDIMNRTGTAVHCKVSASLITNGETVCNSKCDVWLNNGRNDKSLKFDMVLPQLWSPDSPVLYELLLEVAEGIDVVGQQGRRDGLAGKRFEVFAVKGEPDLAASLQGQDGVLLDTHSTDSC
jgi:predicted nucleic acid-binding Zn ribbon protein